MGGSTRQFDRWASWEKSSWPYRVFQSHEKQLTSLYWAYQPTVKFVYSTLKQNSASWDDLPSKHFTVPNMEILDRFKSIRAWSDSYNEVGNWINLNTLLAISSYLEIYMASVISLALESDIGIPYGLHKQIDGVYALKYGKRNNELIENYVKSCVMGEWSARSSAFKSLFGSLPADVEKNISDLDAMRRIRNKVGHAFGRDIEDSRKRGIRQTSDMERLADQRVTKFLILAKKVALAIDKQLLSTHIGEFEAITFYHQMYPSLPQNAHINIRADLFRQKLGTFIKEGAGKLFCQGLVKYYEEL